ncbi:MAG: ABC transporter ATP-binding protein [Cytophagales bacterium]|nr:ABC transporter ATP-binding protein [Cytophagales bacterium]
MNSLLHLNKYFVKYKYYFLSGIVFVIISNAFSIVPAQLVKHCIDLITENVNIQLLFQDFDLAIKTKDSFYQSIFFYGVLMLIMALLRGLFLYLTRQTIIVMSRHIEYDLKNEIYEHYQRLPLSFYRQNNTGDLMARISEDVGKVRMYVGPAVMYGLNLVILFTLVISYMYSVNSTLATYVLLPLPLLSISIYYVSDKINKQSERIQASLSDLSTFVQEAFSGIRVLKAFARELDSKKRFETESNHYKKESLKLALINGLFFPLILFLIGASTILTIYIGGVEVMKGTITVGTIAEFMLYVNMLTWPVTSLGWITSLVQRAAASQTRINEFLDTQTNIVSTENDMSEIQGNIRFENVSLTYEDSNIIALQNISFEIEQGKTLAVIGNTGSGKSTLANLITRMYDVTEGQVFIDNKKIQAFDVQHLRGEMGYVPQDAFLFSDSIRNNVAFGYDNPTNEQIEQATKDASVYNNIIDFPDQFETVLGERGITLSGGQKQRLTLARALIRNPKILILDDSLSAVDTKTEDEILTNLERIMKNRTSVIISHRVSSVKLADKIIVLEDGEIAEQGTHQELLATDGHYKQIYESQLEEK